MKYITRSILNRRIIIYICLEKDQNVMCVVYDAEREMLFYVTHVARYHCLHTYFHLYLIHMMYEKCMFLVYSVAVYSICMYI